MASKKRSRLEISKTAKVLSIGSTPISAMARHEMKRFSSARPGAALQTKMARNYLRLPNLRPLFAAHRNLRLNHRSRRPHASRWLAKYRRSADRIGFLKYSANAKLHPP